jgi:NADH-quinone oxidoreductase subunit K
MTVPASYFFFLSLILFILGIIAFFVKRDLISQFMAVEVMLNSANLAFLALARSSGFADAQAVVLFIITVAAAEASIGLAIVLLVFRRKKSIRTADLNSMKG